MGGQHANRFEGQSDVPFQRVASAFCVALQRCFNDGGVFGMDIALVR